LPPTHGRPVAGAQAPAAAACGASSSSPHRERSCLPPRLSGGGSRGGLVIPASPMGDSKAAANQRAHPPKRWGVKRRPGMCPPPPRGVKRRPSGPSSPSPRLHHPGILFRQPGVTSTRTCSSGRKFSLMEAASRQHRYKTASEPRRSKTACHRVPMGVLDAERSGTTPGSGPALRLHPSRGSPCAPGPPRAAAQPLGQRPIGSRSLPAKTGNGTAPSAEAAPARLAHPRQWHSPRVKFIRQRTSPRLHPSQGSHRAPGSGTAPGCSPPDRGRVPRLHHSRGSHCVPGTVPGSDTAPGCSPPGSGKVPHLQPSQPSAIMGSKPWPHQDAAGTFIVSCSQYTSSGLTP
jgi:hypothetical protein